MGGLYVELLVDLGQATTIEGSVRYRPDQTNLPRSKSIVKIACDAEDHVVVYRLKNPGELVIWTRTQWRDNEFTSAPPNLEMLEEVQWGMLSTCLQSELETARDNKVMADRTARAEDAAVLYVPPPAPPATAKSVIVNTLQYIAGGIVLIVIIAGVIAWDHFTGGSHHRGDLGNGERCSADRECASQNCRYGTCEVRNANFPDGERCDYSENCASHYCNYRHVCSQH